MERRKFSRADLPALDPANAMLVYSGFNDLA